jgi:ubiquinone/menaquinone biosynthesis C-methylase UbiE
MTTPPVCDYQGSDYQTSFWDQGGREYEDLAEGIALERLLPKSGNLLLELGAGAGRNTPRYKGFKRVILLDYSTTQLAQAQERLRRSDRYVFVAADIYRLPFIDSLFDAATMIRTLHHMADAPEALAQVRDILQPGGTFILEFANKLNLKAIVRYLLGRQKWSPFTLEPVEFVVLNFDFHPKMIRRWLEALDFSVERTLTVSHFRIGFLKRLVPAKILAALDGIFQPTGALWQFSPSVFVKSVYTGSKSKKVEIPANPSLFFKCLNCGRAPLADFGDIMKCPHCNSKWAVQDGIYDFRAQK